MAWIRTLLTVMALLVAGPLLADGGKHPAKLVGQYEGGQMEVAAALELRADGRFSYALGYGALDESAEGSWEFDGSAVLLTSDPVAAPRFVVLGQKPAPGGLRIALGVPRGMSRQYFDALVTFADGRTDQRQFGEDGLTVPFRPGERLRSVRLVLGMYEVASEPIPIRAPAGTALTVRFEPRDLGKVAFARTPLKVEGGVLQLQRYDRLLRFRK